MNNITLEQFKELYSLHSEYFDKHLGFITASRGRFFGKVGYSVTSYIYNPAVSEFTSALYDTHYIGVLDSSAFTYLKKLGFVVFVRDEPRSNLNR